MTPHTHHEEPGPRVVELHFRVEGVHSLSEGGLAHIIERMWVGLASIQVGQISRVGQYTGGFTSIVDYLFPLRAIYFHCGLFISIVGYLFMMSCTIYHFSPFWTFMRAIYFHCGLFIYSTHADSGFRFFVIHSPQDHRDPRAPRTTSLTTETPSATPRTTETTETPRTT